MNTSTPAQEAGAGPSTCCRTFAAVDGADWAGRGFSTPYADPEMEPEAGS
jgi:hypothetical protein